jgi:hypothetical protein
VDARTTAGLESGATRSGDDLEHALGGNIEIALKPGFFLWAFCGTTEVMPCYKARFDGIFAAA